MNKHILALTVLLAVSFSISVSLIPLVSAAEDSWTTLEPMPTARSGLGVAVVDGKIYAIGGRTGIYLGTNEMYDPATNTWTTKQPMPTPRTSFGIAVYQNKIYVIGGIFQETTYGQSGFTGVNEVYDPSTDTWTTLEPMPTSRAQLDANVVGNKIYLIGGSEYSDLWPFSQGTAGLNEVYIPSTDSWSTKTPDPVIISIYPSAVVDNKIYILRGTTQIYNPETDSWSYGEAIPTGSHDATMTAAGATTGVLAPKRIYVFGGNDGHNVAINLNQVYNPETDTWTSGTSMRTPRWALAVAVVNDELYAIGGRTLEQYFGVNEKYTPVDYIPEFPSWTPLLFSFVVLLVALALYKRRLHRIKK